ncbi:hypothetical protein [Agrilactobacillus composti]|uniref:hypothetical protein n=1 Tax=Agrilactobacillus composti TaxID=398555 RepID=UPI00137733C1|nr:hypothetical protein [Agrilactobacillus composti]
MTKQDIEHRLSQELYTICDHFDIEIDDRQYTEDQYQDLKRTLLTSMKWGWITNK